MPTLLFSALLSFVAFSGPATAPVVAAPPPAPECTMTCTISVDGIGITATAGGWFVSCETAAERACEEVYATALELLYR